MINYRERAVTLGGERFKKNLDLVGGDELPDLFRFAERGGQLVTLSGPLFPGSPLRTRGRAALDWLRWSLESPAAKPADGCNFRDAFARLATCRARGQNFLKINN